MRRIALLIGVITLINLCQTSSCPNFFNGTDCGKIECLNGGYVKDEKKQICTCPPGYLGIHCEAVKTSMPPDNHFRAGGTSFNVLNVNLHTHIYGVNTYSNVVQGLENHFTAYPNGYDSYNLVQSTNDSVPYLDYFDQEQYNFKFDTTTSAKPFSLSGPVLNGLYWCYPVPIYEQLVTMIQQRNLRNTVITVITEHPPSSSSSEDAQKIAVSFGVRVNAIWMVDNTYSRCNIEAVAPFKTFVDITGGLFVQAQADAGDAATQQLVSQVLMTHYKPQYVSIQSFDDCKDGKSVPVIADPLSGSYNFVLLGDNAKPTVDSYRNCSLQSSVSSFKNPEAPASYQMAVFQSTQVQCTSLTVTSNGSCTAIIFTNAADDGPLNLAVYTTYVEDTTVDASRYSIIENVPFFAAFHVEEAKGSVVTVNSVNASYDSSWNPKLENRGPAAAYEWVPNTPIKCDASQTYSLFLNVSVASATYQRAVRVACLPTPVVTTSAPATSETTTPSGTITSVTTVVTSTSAPTSTGVASSTTSASATSKTTTPSGTSTSVTTIVTSTSAPTSTGVVSSTTEPTKTCNSSADHFGSFLFAYATDFDLGTWKQVQQTIVQAITADQSRFTNDTLGSVRTDTKDAISMNYTYSGFYFSVALENYAPNANLALEARMPSNGLDAIRTFLSNSTTGNFTIEDSVIVLMVNRLPKSTDDLTEEEYNTLTNMNVKIFPIITIDYLAHEGQVPDRSGAVYNRIAAQTNGHYIVANNTIGKDVNSDYNKIVSTLMQSGYGKDLLFSRNIGANRAGNTIGTVRIPKSASGKINVTITLTLSAVDGNAPQRPNRLLLAFKPNGDTKSVSIDFLASDSVTRYDNSNFYSTTVELDSGYDRDTYLIYSPGPDDSDLLIRMWIENNAFYNAEYESFDEFNGAALRVKINNQCYVDKPATLLITDCNGEVSTKYDVDQKITNGTVADGFPNFYFVPFFCDSKPVKATCVNGADSKYDVQFVADDFSITRSFQCRPGTGERDSKCLLQDANGNYQCSGTSPFKRGPIGSLTDCSNHGHLEYNGSSDGSISYNCVCDDGYSGQSCESVSCSVQNTDPLATDNNYHTYTVVLGLEVITPVLTVIDDAKDYFGLSGTGSFDNIWKYQLISYCADGAIEMIYSGSDLDSFRKSFDLTPLRACNADGKSQSIDLTKVYQTAVQGLGRNVKGAIVYFSEMSSMLNVTLNDFVQASQAYQQQVFVFTMDKPKNLNTNPKIDLLDNNVALAVMSTGGFLQQSKIPASTEYELDATFIPALIASSSSIAVYSTQQSSDFSFATEKNSTTAYLLTWKISTNLKNNQDLLAGCFVEDDTSLSCKLTGHTTYSIKVSDTDPFYVAVYILDDVAPKAEIISDLAQDAANAVSTNTSDTRTILSIYVPDGYSVVENDGDGGVTRNGKRTSCTFQWTAYSVFVTEKYKAGANVAQITLQKDGGADKYTRYFAFGTSGTPVCKNGGTPNLSTGSCNCSTGFQGPDCSLVNCVENSLANAWADVCVCLAMDDVACASRYTSKSLFF